MTADRISELLRELQTLELMRQHLATFTSRDDTRDAWRLVVVAIDDRCAIIRGVLSFEDADLVRECEMRLAREPGDGDASVLGAFPSSAAEKRSALRVVTIH